MTIIRSPRIRRDFTIISNSVCLDDRLSMRALGLLVRLLCRPDNWRTNSETLAREFGTGREQMRGVLRELSAAGYMRLIKSRDEKGQWATHWAVFDEPQIESPEYAEPAPGKPYVGALGPITRTDLPRTENNTPPTPKGASTGKPAEESPAEHLNTGFAEFWKTYPKKVGKDAAASAWKRKVRSLATCSEIMKSLDAQKRSEDWKKDNGQFIPNPATWLNQGRWKDEGTSAADTSSARYI